MGILFLIDTFLTENVHKSLFLSLMIWSAHILIKSFGLVRYARYAIFLRGLFQKFEQIIMSRVVNARNVAIMKINEKKNN